MCHFFVTLINDFFNEKVKLKTPTDKLNMIIVIGSFGGSSHTNVKFLMNGFNYSFLGGSLTEFSLWLYTVHC